MRQPTTVQTVAHENNFDFVRLFAAFLVLAGHQSVLSGRGEPAADVLDRTMGTIGVFIFFSISGYLVTQSWHRSTGVAAFAVNRITRIYPGFATCTLLAAFVLGPLVSTLPDPVYFARAETIGYLHQLYFSIQLGLPGVFETNPFPRAVNGSLWTIPIELTWYVFLVGLGVVGVLRRPMLLIATTTLFVAYTLQQFYTGKHGTAPPLIEFGTFFLIGASATNFRARLLRHRGTALCCVAAGATICCGIGVQYVALLVLLPISAILVGESRTPVLHRFGRFGDFSYGTYLYAFPVQQTICGRRKTSCRWEFRSWRVSP